MRISAAVVPLVGFLAFCNARPSMKLYDSYEGRPRFASIPNRSGQLSARSYGGGGGGGYFLYPPHHGHYHESGWFLGPPPEIICGEMGGEGAPHWVLDECRKMGIRIGYASRERQNGGYNNHNQVASYGDRTSEYMNMQH